MIDPKVCSKCGDPLTPDDEAAMSLVGVPLDAPATCAKHGSWFVAELDPEKCCECGEPVTPDELETAMSVFGLPLDAKCMAPDFTCELCGGPISRREHGTGMFMFGIPVCMMGKEVPSCMPWPDEDPETGEIVVEQAVRERAEAAVLERAEAVTEHLIALSERFRRDNGDGDGWAPIR